MAKGYYLVIQDKTTCGGVITEGDHTHTLFGKAIAREQDHVTCGKHPGMFIIVGHIPGDSVMGRMFAGTLHSKSSCPCQARFIPSMVNDTYDLTPNSGATKANKTGVESKYEQQTQNTNSQKSEEKVQSKNKQPPLITPVLIFKTKRKMDDYDAQDMHHGDLTEDVLKNKFDLRDVSARVDPYTGTKLDPSPYSYYLPQKEVQLDKGNSARILFDEFRDLSDSFSFYGEYKGVMRRMITHMQGNTGTPFNDPLLDQALKEQILNDTSSGSSLIQIKQALADNIDADEEIYPLARKGKLTESVSLHSKLPKFDDLIDRINGLVITVHDTWSTEITLESLDIHGSSYSAQIKYKVQDHFGLDDYDISNRVFHQFRIFRIWYTLQRWENYGFRPFITEMNTTITITGEVR